MKVTKIFTLCFIFPLSSLASGGRACDESNLSIATLKDVSKYEYIFVAESSEATLVKDDATEFSAGADSEGKRKIFEVKLETTEVLRGAKRNFFLRVTALPSTTVSCQGRLLAGNFEKGKKFLFFLSNLKDGDRVSRICCNPSTHVLDPESLDGERMRLVSLIKAADRKGLKKK